MIKSHYLNEKGEEREGLFKSVKSKVREASLAAMSMKPVKKSTTRIGSSKFITAFFGSVIILLMLATSWLTYNKLNEGEIAYRSNPVEDSVKVIPVQEQVDDLKNQMEMWNYRVWLLALAVNENANISQTKTINSYGCYQRPQYIVFDKDWKINRHPHTMELTPDHMNILKDHIK